MKGVAKSHMKRVAAFRRELRVSKCSDGLIKIILTEGVAHLMSSLVFSWNPIVSIDYKSSHDVCAMLWQVHQLDARR